MSEYSRRALVAAGGLMVGAAIVRASVSPIAPRAEAAPVEPSPGTVPITRVPDPVQIAGLLPTTCATAMQQVERTDSGEFFITQSLNGSVPGCCTTVVTRLAGTATSDTENDELDAMTILDGGHGLGLHIEHQGGVAFVWISLQGPVSQGDPNGGRLARFAYTPGVWAIDAIPGGVVYLPQFTNLYGEHQESVYNFDWAKGYAVERMFDFRTGQHERYTRRRISDVLRGVDRPAGRITLPVNAPTLQGFATVDDTFFRWVGVGNAASGAPVPSDPMAMEQYDWSTGARIATRSFPTLAQESDGTWRDEAYEPEGCSVSRSADGTASLLVGVTTGTAGDHRWPVFEFAGIGTA